MTGYDENDTVVVACDHVFASIGQYVDWGDLLKGTKADFPSYEAMKRQRPRPVNFRKATETLRDMRSTLIEEQIAKEAKRCLGRGVSIVDPYMCIGCGVCFTKCEFDAIRLEKTRDATPPASMAAWGENVAVNAASLMQKLAAKAQAEAGSIDSTGAVDRIPGLNVAE